MPDFLRGDDFCVKREQNGKVVENWHFHACGYGAWAYSDVRLQNLKARLHVVFEVLDGLERAEHTDVVGGCVSQPPHGGEMGRVIARNLEVIVVERIEVDEIVKINHLHKIPDGGTLLVFFKVYSII